MKKYVSAYEKRETRRREEWDEMNYMLGQYIAFATNQPKKYPSSPFMQKNKHIVMSDKQMENNMIEMVKATGGNIIP